MERDTRIEKSDGGEEVGSGPEIDDATKASAISREFPTSTPKRSLTKEDIDALRQLQKKLSNPNLSRLESKVLYKLLVQRTDEITATPFERSAKAKKGLSQMTVYDVVCLSVLMLQALHKIIEEGNFYRDDTARLEMINSISMLEGALQTLHYQQSVWLSTEKLSDDLINQYLESPEEFEPEKSEEIENVQSKPKLD